MSAADPELIAWLGRPTASTAADASMLGGKGASLDRLTRMGFRVPPGFCVTTAAFRRQVRTTGFESAGDPSSAPLDPVVLSAVTAAMEELVEEVLTSGDAARGSDPRFAVRSSAIGEDSSSASYAGLHDTELDVPPDEVASAIRRCWASLWSAPAVAYRERRNLPNEDAAMSVVVQALVSADAAAVAFTRHPVSGREDQVVVTGVRGLGDAMVAGTITPDTWVIDRSARTTVSFDRGEGPGGPSLDAGELAELVELCLAVEAGFGAPVDVEAAIAAGRWYLLQARPITTGALTTNA